MSQAKLYNEKTALIYQVETLKDRLDDVGQDIVELKHELQRNHSVGIGKPIALATLLP